jgi:malonyl-CoA/methylmalonyl-CoA synthetase
MPNPLYDTLFGAHAGSDAVFLRLAGGSQWSYAAFLATAARYAHALTASGLGPGDRLAAQIHKSPEALALYAACVQAGIIFLPLNTAYTVDELSYFIENSGARMVVCDGAATEASRAGRARLSAMVETLNADGSGSLAQAAEGQAAEFAPLPTGRRTTWPRFSTPPARRGARRARC